MICATRDIILLNKRLDKASRRDVFIATQISGVSVYDNRQSSKDGGFHSPSETFKIRIPINAVTQNGKAYLPETHYDDAENVEGFWTIHTEDLIIVCASEFEDVHTSVFETDAVTAEQAEAMAKLVGFQKELIHVVDYSDNTLRGSAAVKHWRIGGV